VGEGSFVHYTLLGPLGVSDDDGPLEINGALRRTLLAALLLRPNQVVSAERLAGLLWGDRPRASANAALHNQVLRLRRALGPYGARVRAAPPGYVIDVGAGELDTVVFAEHRAAGARAAEGGDWVAASREYGAALALFRGRPLADVAALQGSAAVLQLCEERVSAVQERIEADLHLGRHGQVVGELRGLIGDHPWREAFHGQFMLALYRLGRPGEALEVYRELRRGLAAEVGVEPGDGLRELHRRILRADSGLGLASSSSRTTRAARQLPADTRAFTGREEEIEALLALSRGVRGFGEGGARTCSISGMGGVGKTALAVHCAHRLAERYPDGQLFIDLRGHSADLQPLSPHDALDLLLRSLGVSPGVIPPDPRARAAFYQSQLAGTRTLLLLDNAGGGARVRPLIPVSAGCLVIVTSRAQLVGVEGGVRVRLDALPADEAVGLLSRTAGPGRVKVGDPAASELVQWCGRLPLALRILGARLRHRPMLDPTTLLAILRSEGDPLARLKDDDRDVTRVFASSVEALPGSERQLFGRLGLVPGLDFDAHAAGALQDTNAAEAERVLVSLLDNSLLVQHKEGRYRLHDLLRAYAQVRVGQEEPAESRAAMDRLLDYYVTAAASARKLWPGAASRAGGAGRGKAWFDAEFENLRAAYNHAALSPQRRLELAMNLTPYLRHTGAWDQASALQLFHLMARVQAE
jgi:DNA-binding SARP family transcriptional activator